MKRVGEKRLKQNSSRNRGFSLVEVLIAVAILAILTLPILSTFASSAKINARAKKQENANALAQQVVERFKALPIEQLTEGNIDVRAADKVTGTSVYKGINNVSTQVADVTVNQPQDGALKGFNTYRFAVANKFDDPDVLSGVIEPYYIGEDGQKYFVDVTLSPDQYVNTGDSSNNVANDINSYDMPEFTDVNSDTSFVIMQQIYKNDEEVIRAFKEKYAEELERKQIRKKVTIQINVIPDKQFNINGQCRQSVEITVAYISKNAEDKSISYTYSLGDAVILPGVTNEGGKVKYDFYNVNLFYNPYDIYIADGSGYADDRIDINCNIDSSLDVTASDLKIYIVQQQVMQVQSSESTGQQVYLNKDKVSLYYNGSSNKTSLSNGTLKLENLISIYSNMQGWNKNDASSKSTYKNGLTQGGQAAVTKYLYTITVQIWLDEKVGNPFLTITSTKEN